MTIATNNQAIERYSRQLILSEWSLEKQERLRNYRVLVDSSLPSTALYLAALGIGTIYIHPPDERLLTALRRLNSDISVHCWNDTGSAVPHCEVTSHKKTSQAPQTVYLQRAGKVGEISVRLGDSGVDSQGFQPGHHPVEPLSSPELTTLDAGLLAAHYVLGLGADPRKTKS